MMDKTDKNKSKHTYSISNDGKSGWNDIAPSGLHVCVWICRHMYIWIPDLDLNLDKGSLGKWCKIEAVFVTISSCLSIKCAMFEHLYFCRRVTIFEWSLRESYNLVHLFHCQYHKLKSRHYACNVNASNPKIHQWNYMPFTFLFFLQWYIYTHITTEFTFCCGATWIHLGETLVHLFNSVLQVRSYMIMKYKRFWRQ